MQRLRCPHPSPYGAKHSVAIPHDSLYRDSSQLPTGYSAYAPASPICPPDPLHLPGLNQDTQVELFQQMGTNHKQVDHFNEERELSTWDRAYSSIALSTAITHASSHLMTLLRAHPTSSWYNIPQQRPPLWSSVPHPQSMTATFAPL